MKFIDHTSRMSEADWKAVFKRMELPNRFWAASIKDVSDFPARAAFTRYWQAAPLHVSKGRGLYLHGPLGTGKSTMAALVAKRVSQYGIMSLWIRMRDMVGVCVENKMYSDTESYLERIQSVPLLIIDEVIIHEKIRFSEEHLEEVVRHRVDKTLATIITSNVDIQSMVDRFSSLGSILHEKVFMRMEVSVEDRRGTPKPRVKEVKKSNPRGTSDEWTH